MEPQRDGDWMSSSFDVPEALQKRVSTIAVDDLAKRGMRTVKVLDKAAILSLVDEAVEQVVASRLQNLDTEDRDKIREEAKSQFKKLVAERNSHQKEKQQAYEDRIENLRAQAVSLEEKLVQAESAKEEIARQAEEQTEASASEVLKPAVAPVANPVIDSDQLKEVIREAVAEAKFDTPSSSDTQMEGLKASIDALASKVTSGSSSRGSNSTGSKMTEPPSEEALVALFSKESGEKIENNLDQVEVKNAKAGGVSANLAKLKNLQKETE